MSARHRYLLTDLVTDTPLGYLPLNSVSYSRRINTPGDFNGTVPVRSGRVGDMVRFMMNRPVALYAERRTPRGTALWWGGIVWVANPSRGRRGATTCQLNGATFDSIADHRFIWDDYELSEPLDRAAVVADLWEHMQTRAGNSSIGVDVPVPPTIGGDLFDGSWTADQNVTYGQAITDLTEAEPAFETTIDVYADPDGTRVRKLRFGTPLLGDPDRTHVLATPGTLVTWSGIADHTVRGTHGLARGAAVGLAIGGDVVPLVSDVAVNQSAVDDGYPRVDVTQDFTDDDIEVLNGRAAGLVVGDPAKPSITVRLPDTSSWSPPLLGEMGRVVINDPAFVGGRLDTTARVIGVQVKAAERGQDEEVTFEFQPDGAAA